MAAARCTDGRASRYTRSHGVAATHDAVRGGGRELKSARGGPRDDATTSPPRRLIVNKSSKP